MKSPIIKYLYFSKNNNRRIEKEKEQINNIESWKRLKKIINDKKFKNIKKSIKLKLASYFTDSKNIEELKILFGNDIYEYIKQKSIEFLNDEKRKNQLYLNDEEKKIINENEMIKINLKSNENKKEKEDELKKKQDIVSGSKTKKTETNIIVESNYIYNSESSNSFLVNNNNNSSKYKNIFKFIKIIGKHENRAEFIKEVGNNYLISGGSDKMLLIYNKNFSKTSEIKTKQWIYNIASFENSSFNQQKIMVCMKDKLSLYYFDNYSKRYNKDILINQLNYYNYFKFKITKCLVCTDNGVKKLGDVSNLIESYHLKNLLNSVYKGGLMLNNNEEAVLTSNQVIKDGKDELIFFDDKSNRYKDNIEGYSFIDSSNGIYLISREEKDITILLCACKKYLSEQKNGILLINSKKKGESPYEFYDTNNYEVYCFCQIIYKENVYILDDDKNKRYYTDYIFVGGFDKDKQKGVIKLYKMENDITNLKIKYISDMEFDNIDFKNPISCILQYNCSNNLLIVTLDGNVCLFRFDIKLFLFNELEKTIEIEV